MAKMKLFLYPFQEKFFQFSKCAKEIVLIKNEDHSLSNQVPLKKIIKELKVLLKI